MSGTLEGHLEDVDLDEVVKVIGLSRRSGVLTVDAARATAEVLFHYGRVVRIQLSTSTDTVGKLLQTAGVLGAHDLAAAGAHSVDDVLRLAQERRPTETGLISRAEAVLKEKIEAALLEMLALDNGSFRFKISEPQAAPTRYPRDTCYIVPDGVDGDSVAREAKRRRQAKERDPLGRVARAGARSSEGDPIPELLVVDDDPRFLGALENEGAAAGIGVSALDGSRAGLDALTKMNGESPPQLMVVDLVMPRANGRGLLGGLEVLRSAHERGLADRLFLAFDEEHADARRLADELGARAILMKPRSGEGFAGFLNPILERLGRPIIVDTPVDLVSELRVELGESGTDWSADPDLRLDDHGRALEVLKSLLGQVNNPEYEDEIPLLLLRFAAAFFTRGALFGVHHDSGTLVGLGGYGVGTSDPGRTIHAIKIPMGADTVFTRAVREKCGVRQPFYESEWNLRLMSTLGGPRPREVYTAPLLSPRGIEAVLYADNAIDGRPFPDIALLEIFVQQVGVAIERSSLVRQVERMVAQRAGAAVDGLDPASGGERGS